MEHMEEFSIPEEAIERLKDPSALNKMLEEGHTFQRILGYTDEVMDKFYGAARRLFEEQRYEEAAEAFIFLTTLSPHTYNYWLGLGMSEQLNDDADGALVAYGMAILADPHQPGAHYHSAACYKTIGDDQAAIASLEWALACCEGNSELQQWKERVKAAKQGLQ